MIGKVPRAGSGFRGLVSYLMKGRKDQPDPDRVAWASTRNLLIDDVELAPRLMRAVAQQSTRTKRPVYHLVISWHELENPNDEMMRLVGDTTIADLDLHEHQAVLIAHRDTDHKHLHIVVNRVHPDTGKTWHAGMDYARIEKSLRRQAEILDIPYVPGRFNDPDKFFGKSRAVRDSEVQASIRHGKALPKDRWAGAIVKARRAELAPVIEEARSWRQLAIGLAKRGLTIEAKGQGAVIADERGFMKLSDLGKQVRLSSLEDMYGEAFKTYLERAATEPPLLLMKPQNDRVSPLGRPSPTELPLKRGQPATWEAEDGNGPAAPADVIAAVELFAGDHVSFKVPRDTHVPSAPVPPGETDDAPGQVRARASEVDTKKAREDEAEQPRELTDDEKAQLREEMLAKRLAERGNRAQVVAPVIPASVPEREDIPLTPTVQVSAVDRDNEALSDAKKSLSGALDELQFAKALEEMGVGSEAAVERVKQAVDTAREDIARHQSLGDWLHDQVGDALRAKAQKKAPETKPEPEPDDRDRDDDDERDL